MVPVKVSVISRKLRLLWLDNFRRSIPWRALPFLTVIAALLLALIPSGIVTTPALAAHQGEETANFLPTDTDFYLTANLDPSSDQLTKFWTFLNNWWQDPNVKAKWGEKISDFAEESLINIENDVLPWLGPEIAIGMCNLISKNPQGPESAIFVGTMNKEASDAFFNDKFLPYVTDETGTPGNYGGIETLYLPGYPMYFAFTDEYIIASPNQTFLESTLDMILDPALPSLADNADFQQCQAALTAERVGMLYCNIANMWNEMKTMPYGTNLEEVRSWEKSNVQWAVDNMMVYNGIATIPNPVSSATATNDMGAFPDTTSDDLTNGDKVMDPWGDPYTIASGNDKAGYVLYKHDGEGDNSATFLIDYMWDQYTIYYYTIDADGTVHQFNGPDPATATENGLIGEQATLEDILAPYDACIPPYSAASIYFTSSGISTTAYCPLPEAVTLSASEPDLLQSAQIVPGNALLFASNQSVDIYWQVLKSGLEVAWSEQLTKIKTELSGMTFEQTMASLNAELDLDSAWTEIAPHLGELSGMSLEEAMAYLNTELGLDLDALWAQITPYLTDLSGLSFEEAIVYLNTQLGLNLDALWAQITPYLADLSGLSLEEAIAYLNTQLGLNLDTLWTEIAPHLGELSGKSFEEAMTYLDDTLAGDLSSWWEASPVMGDIIFPGMTFKEAVTYCNGRLDLDSKWAEVTPHLAELSAMTYEQAIIYLATQQGLDLNTLWAELVPHLTTLKDLTYEQAIVYLDTQLGSNLDALWAQITPHLITLKDMPFEQAIIYLGTQLGFDLNTLWSEITPHLDTLSGMTFEEAMAYLNEELGIDARWNQMILNMEEQAQQSFDETISHLDEMLSGMDGESATALLPVSFEQQTPDMLFMLEVEDAAAMKQELDSLFNSMALLWLGLEIQNTTIDGVSATIITNKPMEESGASLGYLCLDVNGSHYLIISTTADALEAAVKAQKGETSSLAEKEAYQGVLSLLPASKMSLAYFDLSGIMSTIMSQQQQDELNRVQDVVNWMMVDNGLTTINGIETPTNEMNAFPDTTTTHGTAGVGWTIYECDIDGDGVYDPGDWPYQDTSFFWQPTTTWSYTCSDDGVVTQQSNEDVDFFLGLIPLQCALGYSTALIGTDAITMTGAIYLLPPPLIEQEIPEGTTGPVDIPEQVSDFSYLDLDVGRCAFSVTVNINNAPAKANIAITAMKELPADTISGFELAAADAGVSIVNIAYGIVVDKTNLAPDNIGTATITMKVGKIWANAYGVDNVKVFRISGGTREALPTTFKGYEGDYAVFEGTSINGLSTFGLMAVSPLSTAFVMSDLVIDPGAVTVGESVTITAKVTNGSIATGNYTVSLKLNGAEVDSKQVTLASGASETVSFTVTENEAGTYTVDVNGLSGDFTVSAEEEPAEEPEETEAGPTNWGLIGGIMGGVIVVATLVTVMFRRRSASA